MFDLRHLIWVNLIKGAGWTLASIFIAMHVAAWFVTVEMLTRLTRVSTK